MVSFTNLGVLYRYDSDGSVHRMIDGLMIPNGMALSKPTDIRHWMVNISCYAVDSEVTR